MSKKILRHPDKEEIIEALSNGESVRKIEADIKEKYPRNKKLWLSSVTLQSFRKKNLQLDGKVLRDIQEAKQLKEQQEREQKKQEQLEASAAYRKKINEIADSKLDVARRILELDRVIESRMEYWFNAVASGEEVASKGDKELRQFIDRQMNLLAQYKKFVEGLADKTVEHNINVTVVNDQLRVIRDVIRECIGELDPAAALVFMEKLENRLNNTSYRANMMPTVKLEENHLLEYSDEE